MLTWDPDGGIIIHDRQRLEATLSVYFRHNRFTSFQRQLNNFGFHKKRKPTACLSGTAAQQRKGAAYDHPLLVGQQPEAVLRLRRDARPRQPRGEASPRRSTARQRSARAPPVGEGAFNLLADVAATELRRENSRGELEADAELLTRNASSSEDLEDRGASASPPRVSDSEGRTSSEERSSSVASSENRNERSSSRDDDGSGSGSDDGHRRQQHQDAPPAIVGGSPRRSPQKPFPVLLKDMLDATSDQILAWSADGSAFEIRDAEALQRDVLPKFFRHVRAGVLDSSRRRRAAIARGWARPSRVKRRVDGVEGGTERQTRRRRATRRRKHDTNKHRRASRPSSASSRCTSSGARKPRPEHPRRPWPTRTRASRAAPTPPRYKVSRARRLRKARRRRRRKPRRRARPRRRRRRASGRGKRTKSPRSRPSSRSPACPRAAAATPRPSSRSGRRSTSPCASSADRPPRHILPSPCSHLFGASAKHAVGVYPSLVDSVRRLLVSRCTAVDASVRAHGPQAIAAIRQGGLHVCY